MAYKIEFRPGVLRQLKKLSKEIEDWVFDVSERLASNPIPENSRTVANSSYMRIKPDRQIDCLETKQYKAQRRCSGCTNKTMMKKLIEFS
ncbi:hypothetical protein [Candidatus Parabeggiatoa sp. HSG14]|uniref:type II toxin-antitoxin system RelE family toxin n=1 Tax=Candidatus Parabeggiatoa sp. HSG14 TaxID=3055593 RepID=UPI0025A6C6B3|nr:hypothetical protein [Thiotrichales bacterium HSG14]